MTTYLELITFFENLPLQVAGLAQCTVGGDEEELSMQTNRIQYPHLRIDTPEITHLNDDENPVSRYKFRFAVMTAVPDILYRNENRALSDMEILMRSIYDYIVSESDDPTTFYLPPGPKTLTPIRRWSGDNGFGWMMDLTIDLYTASC